MTRGINKLKFIIDIALFSITTGVLAYYSGIGDWVKFWVAFFICLPLFLIVQVFNFRTVLKYIDDLEKKEFRYTRSGKNLGLDGFYNLQFESEKWEYQAQIKEMIKSATSVQISSLTASSFIDPNAKLYYELIKEEFLDRNREVEIIIVNPFCEGKLFRDETFYKTKTVSKIESDLSYRFKNYLELLSKYPSLSIFVSNHNFYGSIILSNHAGGFEPYNLSDSRTGAPSRGFGLFFSPTKEKTSESYHAIYVRHFQKLKGKAVPIHKFIEQNDSTLIQKTGIKFLDFNAKLSGNPGYRRQARRDT